MPFIGAAIYYDRKGKRSEPARSSSDFFEEKAERSYASRALPSADRQSLVRENRDYTININVSGAAESSIGEKIAREIEEALESIERRKREAY